MSIDQDIQIFEKAVRDLESGPATWKAADDPGYALRQAVCEASRFVLVSVTQAHGLYSGVLESSGVPEGTTRAAQVAALFSRAIRALEIPGQEDDFFLENARKRAAQVERMLTAPA